MHHAPPLSQRPASWTITAFHGPKDVHDHEIVNPAGRKDDAAEPLALAEPVLLDPVLPVLDDPAPPVPEVSPLGLVLGPSEGAEVDAEELGVYALTLVDAEAGA